MKLALAIIFTGCFLLNGFAATDCTPETCHAGLSQDKITVSPCHKQVFEVNEQVQHEEAACLCTYTNAPRTISEPRLTYAKPAFSSFLISDIKGYLKNKPAVHRGDRIPVQAYIRSPTFLDINRLLI